MTVTVQEALQEIVRGMAAEKKLQLSDKTIEYCARRLRQKVFREGGFPDNEYGDQARQLVEGRRRRPRYDEPSGH